MAVVSRKNENLAVATCLATDSVGAMVSISGPKVGDKYAVVTADPSDYSKMPAVAMIVNKLDSTTCVIQFKGIVRGTYGGLPPGTLLFVDDDGMLSDEPPAPTLTKPFMFSQRAGIALADSEIDLEPDGRLVRQRY